MATQLTVFNDALGMLGQTLLESTTEENEDGDVLRGHWESSVKLCHEKTSWDHAKIRHQCARLSATPTFGFTYYYSVPSDCVRIILVSETGDEHDTLLDWRQENRRIAANVETLYIVYISSTAINSPGKWSESFAHYVATELAFRAAPKLNPSAKDDVAKERKKSLSDAIGLDATQNPIRTRRPGQWARSARGWSRRIDREQS